VLAAVAAPDRIAARYRVVVAIAAVAPFAVLIWWSVLTSLIALLAVVVRLPRDQRWRATPTGTRPG